MKPLKGKMEVQGFVDYRWTIYLGTGMRLQSFVPHTSKPGAIRSAKRFAKRLNIELEVSK